jgi:hypothetical protein
MKIGNTTSVPALNTMHHQHAIPKPSNLFAATSRTESVRSSDSFSFHRNLKMVEMVNGYFGSEADSERESISPPRMMNQHDEVRLAKFLYDCYPVNIDLYVFNLIVFKYPKCVKG